MKNNGVAEVKWKLVEHHNAVLCSLPMDHWKKKKKKRIQKLAAHQRSSLPYYSSFLSLGNISKNNIWSCNFLGLLFCIVYSSKSIKCTFSRWELKTSGLLVADNSNLSTSVVQSVHLYHFLSFGENLSWFYTDIQCQCWVHSLSNASPFLGHMLRFISRQWLEWQFSIFSDRLSSGSGWNSIFFSSGRAFF